MTDVVMLMYHISSDDFTRTGEANSDVKSKLEQMGMSPEAVGGVTIAIYEGEANMVIHAEGGDVTVEISPQCIRMALTDKGPKIPSAGQATQAERPTVLNEIRSLGLGVGIRLPNMRKYADTTKIDVVLGVGATIEMVVNL